MERLQVLSLLEREILDLTENVLIKAAIMMGRETGQCYCTFIARLHNFDLLFACPSYMSTTEIRLPP